MVNGEVNDVGELVTFAAYARHRGISPAAVSKAVSKGKLRNSIRMIDGQPRVAVAAADIEWASTTRSRAAEPSQARPSIRYAVCRSDRGTVLIVGLESEAVHDTPSPDNYIDGAGVADSPDAALRANLARFPDDIQLIDEMTPATARALAAALLAKASD